jgi:hypothetical protein
MAGWRTGLVTDNASEGDKVDEVGQLYT